jgi:hypothetical protein
MENGICSKILSVNNANVTDQRPRVVAPDPKDAQTHDKSSPEINDEQRK